MCPIPKLRGDMLAEGLISADELREMEAASMPCAGCHSLCRGEPLSRAHEALEDVFA
jgi:acetoin:2,6-dichlorophenolindophenol oxidoreductase subunit alpha